MNVQEFNVLSQEQAEQALRPCLDVPRWIKDITEGRPYGSVDKILQAANHAGAQLTPNEVEQALLHHPRIGERARGGHTEARLSREEQAELGITTDIQTQLDQGNAEYEERFDQVFLIRAAGRSSDEILAELRRRMNNTAEQESQEVADQLSQIATLRLKGLFS